MLTNEKINNSDVSVGCKSSSELERLCLRLKNLSISLVEDSTYINVTLDKFCSYPEPPLTPCLSEESKELFTIVDRMHAVLNKIDTTVLTALAESKRKLDILI